MRRRKIGRLLLAVFVGGLSVALVAALIHIDTMEERQTQTEAAWASNCDRAKRTAIDTVQDAVTTARQSWARRTPEAEIDRMPHVALAVYVDACARDDATLEMRGRVSVLAFSLVMARDVIGLAMLEHQLEATPLAQWKSLALPPTPELFLMIAHGDQREADEIQLAADAAHACMAVDRAPEPVRRATCTLWREFGRWFNSLVRNPLDACSACPELRPRAD